MGFVDKVQRLTVAITRAQSMRALVCQKCLDLLKKDGELTQGSIYWRKVIDRIIGNGMAKDVTISIGILHDSAPQSTATNTILCIMQVGTYFLGERI